ncbi:TetR/AcrR family transcriptional regulator [Pseudomonas sp. MDMC216]|jgi:AcrR family transcriptional regulator|uniref:Transcriptional regulator, TetR family n=1 Tax=Ectopseudomonas toyotomiensis TaxID=554344 RepID=A0A1I5RE39_9GAMM|nr:MULTISPECIES: TetR/AcrR family transcriptional regulator [Pseudomonas]APU30051.1 TetR family transcriptional regulator [Pseudomonas alcaliphila JAB1]MBG0846558.1 TetR/AcrR family transcriptional regulator [Pseudomonas chengduensis]MDH1535191.1 TetR/AcrR family transcriptional regulator [Pseudomonas chengduensis]MDH1560830.1 TetR/AcrR family transcriptional regulator [Pseudomonas chengduensis]MDI5994439.1 TetR/AcrR family transcriptional regulator [Pseudomonas sp. MDMC216]
MSGRKSETRKRILAAAGRVLAERGPGDPAVAEVMAEAGLTVGGFYAHFASKDALMLEAFRQLLRVRRDRLAQVDQSLTGRERRVLLAAFYLSRRHRDDADERCPLPSSLAEIARLPDGFRQTLAEHIELITAQMSGTPEEGDVALADLALMIGGLALARALGPGELSDRVLRAAKSAVV